MSWKLATELEFEPHDNVYFEQHINEVQSWFKLLLYLVEFECRGAVQLFNDDKLKNWEIYHKFRNSLICSMRCTELREQICPNKLRCGREVIYLHVEYFNLNSIENFSVGFTPNSLYQIIIIRITIIDEGWWGSVGHIIECDIAQVDYELCIGL